MERSDAEQEGITLDPVTVIRLAAAQEASKICDEHARRCPFNQDRVTERLRTIEITLGRLIGFLLGSGALGGVTGGVAATLAAKLFP